MTKLAVIHLSDIHIHGERDACLKRVDEISTACFTAARSADACVVAVTGDVAFSGAAAEYAVAREKLIEPLISKLKRETGRPVYVALAPGNHDCVLKPANIVRETLINAVVESPEKAEDEAMVIACSDVQQHFRTFSEELLEPKAEVHSRLFWQQKFEVAGHTVVLSTLNASWMSRLPEEQGQLVFPIGRFEEQLNSGSKAFHLALIHHPFNWYSQSAYHALRKRLRRSCTAILSGHEHLGNTGKLDEAISGTSLFFEAAALQPHEEGAQAGFSIHTFDFGDRSVSSSNYLVASTGVDEFGQSSLFSWADSSIGSAPDISPSFLNTLIDAGGNFSHTAKERLALDDVFVWPDLRDWDGEIGKQKSVGSKSLLGNIERGAKFIIYGDDKSGKTTLLFAFFQELVARGFAPVFVSSSEFSVKTKNDPERRIDRLIEEQYSNPAVVRKLPKDRRVLLVDDVDRMKSGVHTLGTFLEHAARHFESIVLTAQIGFEVTNLTSRDTMAALAPFKSYDLMRFGLRLRHALIKKWCSITPSSTKTELDRRIHDVETIVNSVIGKRLVPEYPLYLLILLQSCEQHRHGEIQNSGLSFYYQYLITKSLGEVGVKPSELDEHFNYLSLLAWEFRTQNAKALEKQALVAVNAEFTRRFITVDLSERLSLLTRAHILTKKGDCYSFSYPYVYYFFIGRYLSKNLDNPDVRTWVEESCKKLHLSDRAHAIMFLSHHVESGWVIGQICDVLRSCFSDKAPIELNGDTKFISELVERSSQITLPAPDVESNQSKFREMSDDLGSREDEVAESSNADEQLLTFASKWNLLTKTAEILGLILKNYYGSLERPQKQDMIREVFNGPLRALRLWLEEVAAALPSFVNTLKDEVLAKNSKLNAAEVENQIKRRMFSLCGLVATGAVSSCGNFVSADKLREEVASVVNATPTNAYRLIEAASLLRRPGAVPMDIVRRLASDLEDNPYAFGVLQQLGFYHMYMFHTDEPQKQALCSVLKISFSEAKAIEMKKGGRILRK